MAGRRGDLRVGGDQRIEVSERKRIASTSPCTPTAPRSRQAIVAAARRGDADAARVPTSLPSRRENNDQKSPHRVSLRKAPASFPARLIESRMPATDGLDRAWQAPAMLDQIERQLARHTRPRTGVYPDMRQARIVDPTKVDAPSS